MLIFASIHSHRDSKRLAESEEIGNQIVSAIEKYNKEQKYSPVQLSDLVPVYIDKIQLPTWGLKEWHMNFMMNVLSIF